MTFLPYRNVIARLPLRLSAASKANIQAFNPRAMATSARQQPAWQAPQWPDRKPPLPPIKIWNSLTRCKDLFVPIDWEASRVSWYACGPTVYDDAHLGHARNYVTTDIIRRILREYFQFKVNFVMNITDIDDKVRPTLSYPRGPPHESNCRSTSFKEQFKPIC